MLLNMLQDISIRPDGEVVIISLNLSKGLPFESGSGCKPFAVNACLFMRVGVFKTELQFR